MVQKRGQVAKKEELLGEDTNRLDQAEYKLQSMTSPETHEADRFFNNRPSKQIGPLRVDTLSPAQVSFIQSSTQWHKYFKPSALRVPPNIFPDDPVLFPGMKSTKENGGEAESIPGLGQDGLGNSFYPKHHHPGYDSWNSYGSESDAGQGSDQRQKDYEEPPFTDKSWMNPKPSTGERTPGEGYESFDGKTLAVPEPKGGEIGEHLSHFESHPENEESFTGGDVGLANLKHKFQGDRKADLLEKMDEFSENTIMSQEGDEKELFGEEKPKLFSERPPFLGPTGSLGTALAEELLQKGNGKFKAIDDSSEIVRGRSGTNLMHGLRLLTRPMLDESATQRNLLYKGVNDINGNMDHVVLIRSDKLKDSSRGTPILEHHAKALHSNTHNPFRRKTVLLTRKSKANDVPSQVRKSLKPICKCQEKILCKQNYVKNKNFLKYCYRHSR